MSVVRIRRSGGKIVQDSDCYIGRRCTMGGWNLPQSKWANPYTVKEYGREEALRKYEEYVRNTPELWNKLEELDSKVLGCFCSPQPCHGDILLKLLKEKKLEN